MFFVLSIRYLFSARYEAPLRAGKATTPVVVSSTMTSPLKLRNVGSFSILLLHFATINHHFTPQLFGLSCALSPPQLAYFFFKI